MKHDYDITSFTIANYRSIDKPVTIDLDRDVIAFYGANASGKSNIWRAMFTMIVYILNSSAANSAGTPFAPFLLKEKTAKTSKFEIEFANKDRTKKYQYGFGIAKDKVVDEYLIDISGGKKRNILRRCDGCGVVNNNAKNFGKKIFEATRDDSLIITQAYVFNNKYANIVFDAIRSVIMRNIGDMGNFRDNSYDLIQTNPNLKRQTLDLLHRADFAIKDYDIKKERVQMPDDIKAMFSTKALDTMLAVNTSVKTVHVVRNDDGDVVDTVNFDMDKNESRGTNAFFTIATPIVDSLNKGKTLYVDEFNSSLHSDICKFIVRLFKDKSVNKHSAKLIINTHDTSLMPGANGKGALSTDDIVLVYKDLFEATHVEPMSDKTYIRTNANIEKNYRNGILGGRPMIKD